MVKSLSKSQANQKKILLFKHQNIESFEFHRIEMKKYGFACLIRFWLSFSLQHVSYFSVLVGNMKYELINKLIINSSGLFYL